MRSQPVVTLARYQMSDPHTGTVLGLLREAAAETMAEEGNAYFLSYREHDQPNGIVLVEGWHDQEALDRHRRTPHFQDLVLGRIVPLLHSRTVTHLAPIDMEVRP